MDHEKATIDKMINFIFFEAKEKINELKTKAIEDYNTEKSRLIKERTDAEELELKKKLNELTISRLKKISEVKLDYKMQIARRKEKRVNALFSLIVKRLGSVVLNRNLIEHTLREIEDEELIAYVLKRDRSRIENDSRIKEIRDLNGEMLGGIIVTNKEGTAMVDNSFKKRLEKVKIKFMPRVSKELFKVK